MQGKMRPILFSTPMVNAILEGRKTRTRRLIKAEPHLDFMGFILGDEKRDGSIGFGHINHMETVDIVKAKYKTGDILWVRETIYQNGELGLEYVADGEDIDELIILEDFKVRVDKNGNYKFCQIPNIFMPKYLARIFLRITNIRVERLQEITEQDAISEGIYYSEAAEAYEDYLFDYKKSNSMEFYYEAKKSFQSLWQKINGETSWFANPWVWVIEFERCEKPTI